MKDYEKVEQRFKKLLYIITVLTVITVILPGIQIVAKTYRAVETEQVTVNDGKVVVELAGENVANQLRLNGEWICYEGVYLNSEDEISEKLEVINSELATLPEANLKDASGKKTYQLYLSIDAMKELIQDLALVIDFTDESVKVYLNGAELDSYRPISSWIGGDASYNMYLFEGYYDYEKEYQEVLISINEMDGATDLYRREIGLGTAGEIIELAQSQDVLQMFLVGLMLLSIVMGLIYLIMMPKYSVLTFMNLFDAALMLYIYYNTSKIPGTIITGMFGGFEDEFLRGQALLMLFIAGALGNILGQVIYDPERKYTKIFGALINGLWFGLALVFGMFPALFNDIALAITLVLLTLNFIGLIEKMYKCYKSENWNGYMAFHSVKTIFVGVIIMLDVVTLNTYPRNDLVIVLGYMLYFVIHFFIRAYEYIIPFKQIEKHNEDLERAVEERTQQLVKANEILMDINITDGLTKANNRLYFERVLLETIEKYEQCSESEDLYLCIFDLDDFKTINDTYGHTIGDEQLVELVTVVKEIIPSYSKVSRIGGEEFALIFDGYYEDVVIGILEKIRMKLDELSLKDGRTTGSFGVAKYKRGDLKRNFFVNADRALYHSKMSGKNCITLDADGELKKIEK